MILYDQTRPLATTSVTPPAANATGGATLSVTGSGFAPTAAVPLGCSFAAVGHAPLPTMPASYVSASEVRCVSLPVDGPADAALHLVAIHGGGASAGLPFTFYDAAAPPEISHLRRARRAGRRPRADSGADRRLEFRAHGPRL